MMKFIQKIKLYLKKLKWDEEHDNLAFNCSFCDEFWCASSRWPDSWVLMNIDYWKENNIR